MTIRELIRINEQERAKLAAMLIQAEAEREQRQQRKQTIAVAPGKRGGR